MMIYKKGCKETYDHGEFQLKSCTTRHGSEIVDFMTFDHYVCTNTCVHCNACNGLYLNIYFEIECRQGNVKVQESIDHLASFLSNFKFSINLTFLFDSQEIELPTSSLRFWYLSITFQ